ncbi:TPA: hypothetical protein ACYLN4_000524 [Burkholderia lata]
MSELATAIYLTDDRDLPEQDLRALVIFPGGNGDWYVQVTPPHGRSTEGVRICTSGGASTNCPGLGPAIAEAFRAIMASQNGSKHDPLPSREEMQAELNAWRQRFPDRQFDGFFDIVEAEESGHNTTQP